LCRFAVGNTLLSRLLAREPRPLNHTLVGNEHYTKREEEHVSLTHIVAWILWNVTSFITKLYYRH